MKLCLVAIVKNSGSVLKDCLSSWKPYIDNYCIADTGSTDGTMERIKETMGDTEGHVFLDPFEGFSINRNRVLEEAERRFADTTYYIMVDDSFVLTNGEQLRPFLESKPAEYYAMLIKNEDATYISGRITTKGMRYRYRIHEIIDTDVIPELVPDSCYIHEQRPSDHVKRTQDRTDFDLKQFELDMKEEPDNSRLIFYYARTLFQVGKDAEAKPLFERRLRMGGTSYEIYTSMLYLALIEEQQCELLKKPFTEVGKMYRMVHEAFPYHAEPLFFAALCHYRQSEHDLAIECLEQAIQIPMKPNVGVKYMIYDNYIPKMLASYYFKTKMDECVRLVMFYYIVPKKPFDFMYESYIRHIFRIDLKAPSPHAVVSYHPKGKYNATFSEETLVDYVNYITSYQIEDLVVVDRTDRVPYFPNVKRIHFVVEGSVPKGGMLESFPMLRTIVCQDEAHHEYLSSTFIAPGNKNMVVLKKNFSLFMME